MNLNPLRLIQRLGPGIVYILTVLGTGDLVSNSAAGAGYGYALIWTVAATLIFRFVWINVSAKYVLVTGESLLEGYARLGKWILWIILFGLLLVGHITTMSQMVMIGSAIDVLLHLPTPWSASIWSFFFTSIAFAMAYWGGYRFIEVFAKVLVGVMGAALIAGAFLSKPDLGEVARGMFVPTIPGKQGLYSSAFVLMALIGTMTGSMANLTYAYFIHEKGWKDTSFLKQQRLDLIAGAVSMFVLGSLVQIAAAATIHPLGIDLEDAGDLVRIFSEVQGVMGLIIFSLGLWMAAFSTLVGTAVGYGLILADLSRFLWSKRFGADTQGQRGVNHPIYRAGIIFYLCSPLYILLTGVSPVWLVLAGNSLVIPLLPVLTPALMKITSDKSLMGKYRNHWFTNLILGFLIFVAVYISYQTFAEYWSARPLS